MNFKGFIREARLDDRPDSALKHLVFGNQDDLKKPDYDDMEIWKEGWQRIILPTPCLNTGGCIKFPNESFMRPAETSLVV